MTPVEQLELDSLKHNLRQAELALKQEQGKRIAVERDSYETKRQAKEATEQAQAYRLETDKALAEGADQMRLALAVSQGIYALGQMARVFMARKVAAARVVHREGQLCALMQSAVDAKNKSDDVALKAALDRMVAVITTIKGDGETARFQAVEAAMSYGIKQFEETFDKLVQDNNQCLQSA